MDRFSYGKQLMFTRIALAIALMIGVVAPPTARADSYVIGVENIDYYPQYTVRDGQYAGFARALLDAFAKDSGHVFEYRPYPVARLFQQFLSGEVDFKYPDNAYWSTDVKKGKEIVYSAPVVAYIDGVSVLPARVGQEVGAIRTLGTVRGFTAWDWLDRLNAGTVRLQENNDFVGLLNAALAGRIDGAYANVAVVNHQLEAQLHRPEALVFDPSLPHTKSNYHLSTIKHPKLIAEFDSWLAANADKIAALKAEYAVEKGVQ